jgi:starvation-inducible DNA-binding protein
MAGFFPTDLLVLKDDEGNLKNLIFMAHTGDTWVRRNGEWVDFIINDTDPDNQVEGMKMTAVDPRFIDLWDRRSGQMTDEQMRPYSYVYMFEEKTFERPKPVEVDEAVTAGGVAYDFDGNPLEMALKRLVADSVTAYHHAQGYHWNVKGQDFAQYHALFLSIYEDYLASIDPTAENLLKLGASAPYTHADLDRFRSLPDVSATETPRDMATALLAINDGLRASTKSAFDQAAVADDQGMVDFLGGRLDILDKWSWQLRASIA